MACFCDYNVSPPPDRWQQPRLCARGLELGVVPVERETVGPYEGHRAARRQRRGTEPRRRGCFLECFIVRVKHLARKAVFVSYGLDRKKGVHKTPFEYIRKEIFSH